jgi:hypothetical protein
MVAGAYWQQQLPWWAGCTSGFPHAQTQALNLVTCIAGYRRLM